VKRKTVFVLGLLLSVLLVLALVQPALATEKTVKLKVPGCG